MFVTNSKKTIEHVLEQGEGKDTSESHFDISSLFWGQVEFIRRGIIDRLVTIKEPSRISHFFSTRLNGEEIAEVFLSQAGFTTGTDKKPVLATYGCGPCVSLGGYDATNKIAFVVHLTNEEELIKSGKMIYKNISKLIKEKIETPIQLHLRGGIVGESEDIIESIMTWMTQSEDLPMEIASQKTLLDGLGDPESLAIDSRTGEVYEYDPKDNPQARRMHECEALMARISIYNPTIFIAYMPD